MRRPGRRRHTPIAAVAFTVIAIVGAAACGKRPEPPEALRVHAELSGCDAVRAGPVCEVGANRELRIVVDAPFEADVQVDAGGSVLAPTARVAVDGGVRVHVRIPDRAREARVLVREHGRTGEARFALDERAPPSWFVEATAARKAGRADEAARLAEAHAVGAGYDGALAAGLLGRLAMAREDYAQAERWLREGWHRQMAEGRPSEGASDAFALAYMLSERLSDFAGSRSVLDALSPAIASLPDARAKHAYYSSAVAQGVGDARKMLGLIAETERRAERLGLVATSRDARSMRALVSFELGRFAESCRTQAELLAEGSDTAPCARVQRLMNIAIAAAAARDQHQSEAKAAEATPAGAPILSGACARSVGELLDEALADATCQDASLHGDVWVLRAAEHVHASELREARESLAKARKASTEPLPRFLAGAALVEADLALSAHDAKAALSSYAVAEARSREDIETGRVATSILGAAAAYALRGDVAGALREYARAEAAVDDATLRVPLGEGRASFSGSLDLATRRRLRLLVAHHREREALDVVVASRGRATRDLAVQSTLEHLDGATRDRWDRAASAYASRRAAVGTKLADAFRLPAAERQRSMAQIQREWDGVRGSLEAALHELAPTFAVPTAAGSEPGTLVVAYAPLETGLLGLASLDGDVSAVLLPAPRGASRETLARDLLDPFDGVLARARRVRILVPPSLASVDFHALPWRGAPLIAHAPVDYALAAKAPPAGAGAPGRAVVVGDSRGDLPAARAEAQSVDATLRAHGLSVTSLLQQDATHARLVAALAGTDLLHVAGHARHAPGDPWGASLSLYRTDTFDAADALALSSPPKVVVLSACEGANEAGDEIAIGHAFLLAGSRAVIASLRPVADADARAFSESFHEAFAGGVNSVSDAARLAQLRTMTVPGRDWSAFRVLVP